MARLHVIDPQHETGPGADLLNGPLKQKQLNIFKGLANNPDVLKAYLGFAQGIKSVLTPAEHELIALLVSQQNECGYCLAAHTKIAEGAGLNEDAALLARQGKANDPRGQAILDFTQAMIETKGWVTDAHVNAFRAAGFDDAALVEMIAAYTNIFFTNMFNHLNETEIDFPVPAEV